MDVFRPFDTRFNPADIHIDPLFKKSSVLIPLVFKDGEWSVILTTRSEKLRSHGGDVVFPGGKQDETDKNEIETALREAEEEIGLRKEEVTIIAILPPAYITKDNAVTPVVSLVSSDFVPIPNLDEVKDVFMLPLLRFFEDF